MYDRNWVYSPESSLQMKHQDRSSGDGADAPPQASTESMKYHTTKVVPVTEAAEDNLPILGVKPLTSLKTGFKQSFVPQNVDLSTVKDLIPYKVNSSPIFPAKRNKYRMKPSKEKVSSLNVINEVQTFSSSKMVIGNDVIQSTLNSSPNIKSKLIEIHSPSNESTPIMTRVNQLAGRLSKASVMSPLNDDLLNSPPSSLQNKSLISITTQPPGVPTSKHASVKYQQISRKLYKEPRFIPFEPFKGCVDPMFSKARKKSSKSESNLSVVSNANTIESTEESKGILSAADQDKKARAKLETVVKDFETERGQWEQKVEALNAKCEKLESEVKKAEREKVTLEDQLNIQAQVIIIK